MQMSPPSMFQLAFVHPARSSSVVVDEAEGRRLGLRRSSGVGEKRRLKFTSEIEREQSWPSRGDERPRMPRMAPRLRGKGEPAPEYGESILAPMFEIARFR